MTVSQSGQTRVFAYDPLGRLAWTYNPESGATNYRYDAAGKVIWRDDYRGQQTCYAYDALNRIVQKVYFQGSDSAGSSGNCSGIQSGNLLASTPAVQIGYDPGVPNGKGQIGWVSSASSTTTYLSYDVTGNLTASAQSTAGQTYYFGYTYNVSGAATSETYPSGRVVTTTLDSMNRPVAVTGVLNGEEKSYAAGASYWPHGAVKTVALGNNVWRAFTYNNRLQPESMQDAINNNGGQILLSQSFGWGSSCAASGTTDNGNLQCYTASNGGPGYPQFLTFSQTYNYDGVNRLTGVTDSGGWSRKFNYDAFGNMWVGSNSGVPLAGNTPQTNNFPNNQIGGVSYDAAGNQLTVNGNNAAYDAENRMTSVSEAPPYGSATESFVYDGLGERVEKTITGGAATVYVYDAFGVLAAEYNSATVTPIPPCVTCYVSTDHLGSVRLVTDQNGNVIGRHDFLPFGEEVPANDATRNSQWGAQTDTVETKFTGQVRDLENGLDWFNARYYGPALGRFMSPDPGQAGVDPTDPQTWNGYGYVRNSPMALVDPSGMQSGSPCENNFSCMSQIPGCLANVSACIQKYFATDPLTVWSSLDALQVPSGHYYNDGWNAIYGGNDAFLSTDTVYTNSPTQSNKTPQKNGTKPGPSICAGYGTVCFPTTAPMIQPVNWKKFTMYMSCLAGTPPELMAAASGSPQDVTDSTPETQGSTTVLGYTPGKQKNGGQRPLNPSSAPEVGEAAANAPSYLNNVLACSAVVANMK